MNLLTFNCPVCKGYETSKLDSLRIHCQKRHDLPTRQLYAMLFLPEGKEPTCACGCGEPTKFLTLQRGFSEYVLGHSSRVNNNWGHNKEALRKSLKKRREEGLWSKDPWNRGKTKEKDSEFAVIAERAYNSHKEKIRKSNKMKQQWEEGMIAALTGSSHPQWRGGTSALQPLVRSRLHHYWVYPKLKEGGFKCSKCDSRSNLEVHHNEERFATILRKAILELGEPGDDFQKKSLIAEWVTDYHISKNIPGVVLCDACHDSSHQAMPTNF